MSTTVMLPNPATPSNSPGSGEHKIAADLPAANVDGTRRLLDRYGRVAQDLRVSLTDKCNLRCTYCMPAEGLEWMHNSAVLSDDEVVRLVRIAVEKLGIRKLRFTGGEPLLRKSLASIIERSKALRTDTGEAPEIALTTNGLGLDKRVESLAAAGLDRINISLDTIDREKYTALTRRDRLAHVLRSIDKCAQVGLDPIKINALVMKGVNEDDVVDLAAYALDKGAQLRFIEQMPLGPREAWSRQNMITADEILQKLQAAFVMTPAKQPRGSAPAALWDVWDDAERSVQRGKLGIISSVSYPFCGDCDRTRLTADGAIRTCLFSNSETQLRDHLRQGASDDEIAKIWAGAMWEKLPGHGINDEGFLQPARTMSAIGG